MTNIREFALQFYCQCCGVEPGSVCFVRSNRHRSRSKPHAIRIRTAAKELASESVRPSLIGISRRELKSIAEREGMVYWPFNRIYERLYIGYRGDIMATGIGPGPAGPTTIPHHPIRPRAFYHCIPLVREATVCIGDLFIS